MLIREFEHVLTADQTKTDNDSVLEMRGVYSAEEEAVSHDNLLNMQQLSSHLMRS